MRATSDLRAARFRSLEVKNRIFRSNIAGRLDGYDGSGTQARINWELKFARGGVGAIVSSWTAVDERGKIVPSSPQSRPTSASRSGASSAERVHEHDCRYILQLAYAGRQRDIPGDRLRARGSRRPGSPIRCTASRPSARRRPTARRSSARSRHGARRAREAGLDGVEIHGANGYLFTQFLSSAINDREDDYGGPLENRARLLLETVAAIRAEVGDDFHLQVKISTTEHANAFFPWLGKGNTIEDSVQVCRWLEQAGADAIHVSSGSTFPHPVNPAGEFSIEDMVRTYDVMLSSGKSTFRNYLLFRTLAGEPGDRRPAGSATRPRSGALPARRRWRQAGRRDPGDRHRRLPEASLIAAAIERGDCDAVTIARGLVANNDLSKLFRRATTCRPVPARTATSASTTCSSTRSAATTNGALPRERR